MTSSEVFSLLWLGEKRGYLSDWLTQRWVQLTGRRIALTEAPWLAGCVGGTRGIGPDFFARIAAGQGLEQRRSGDRGLVRSLELLAAPDFNPGAVAGAVQDFYRRTSAYELDSWAEWCGVFKPFGAALAVFFSKRLQQLNVPLSGLDTSRGVTSDVLQLVDPVTGEVRQTAWIRQLVGSGNVLYAGSYSVVDVPGRRGTCVKVVFPLPNGNAIVIMRPVASSDGSLSLVSAGRSFGDPGFYFTVADPDRPGEIWARYLRPLQETIRVYADPAGAGVRADHVLRLWGATFLRLHYRLREMPAVREARALEG